MSKTPVPGPDAPSRISGEILAAGAEPRPRSSGEVRTSNMYRLSGIFDPRRRSGPGASFSAVAPLRRRGLRRRVTAALIVAALGPVLAVSLVAIALIFSSVEQGITFEAERGLQVARGLFLQQVQRIAAGAAGVSEDPALLRALSRPAPWAARRRSTTAPSMGTVTTTTPSSRSAGSTSGSAARTTSSEPAASMLTVRS